MIMVRCTIKKVHYAPLTAKQKFAGYWLFDKKKKVYVGTMGRGPRLFKTKISAKKAARTMCK